MDKLIPVGRIFFAIAIVDMGLGLPQSATFALYAGALGMLFPPTAYLAALLTGVMVFSWVWMVHVPRVFLTVSDNVAVFEALAIAAIALVLAGYRRKQAARI